MKKEGTFTSWATYFCHVVIAGGGLFVAYIVLSVQEAPLEYWILSILAALLVSAYLGWVYRQTKRATGRELIAERWGCGGIFFYLVRHYLFASDDLPKEQERERFAALYATVLDNSPNLRKSDMLACVLTAMLIISPEVVVEGSLREWVEENSDLWAIYLVMFKFFVWDAVAGLVLYRLMRKEKLRSCK